jgi:hypothetical protein
MALSIIKRGGRPQSQHGHSLKRRGIDNIYEDMTWTITTWTIIIKE